MRLSEKDIGLKKKTGWEDINDPVRDRASHKLRALIASGVVFVISIFYLDHIFQIQINDHDLYTTKAEDNRIRVRPIEPIRGNILDRNGITLAESFDTFDIIAKKENIVSERNFLQNSQKVFKFEKKILIDSKENLKTEDLKKLLLKKIPQWKNLLNYQLTNTFFLRWS